MVDILIKYIKIYKKHLTLYKKMYIIVMFYELGGAKMKRTFQPNNRKKAKKHGFFSRVKGKVLNNRRKKGRNTLSK